MVTLYFKVIIQSNYLIKYLLVAIVLSAISSRAVRLIEIEIKS